MYFDMLCLACRQGRSYGLAGPRSVSKTGGLTSSWPFQVSLSPHACGGTFSGGLDRIIRTGTAIGSCFDVTLSGRVIGMVQNSHGVPLPCFPPRPPPTTQPPTPSHHSLPPPPPFHHPYPPLFPSAKCVAFAFFVKICCLLSAPQL